jgi:hypothetical protein
MVMVAAKDLLTKDEDSADFPVLNNSLYYHFDFTILASLVLNPFSDDIEAHLKTFDSEVI